MDAPNLLNLFAVPLHVKRLDGAEMPKNEIGAHLTCYVRPADSFRALELAVETFRQDRYEFLRMNGEIRELNPDDWDSYVRAAWPEDAENLPRQAEIRELLEHEEVFYGPFCCYDNDEDA